MRRHLAFAFLLYAFNAHGAMLLPSQEEPDLVTVKTCRDHEVLSSLKAAVDNSLHTNSLLARGMRANDIRLEAVRIERLARVTPERER